MLGCSYVGDGYGYATGNVSHVTGQGGTFASGMGYDFPYQQPCDNYIDQIGANGGILLFRSQDNHGRVVAYSGPSNSYRAIHSTYVFGAQPNSTHTKDQLMGLYMNYLTQTIGVEEMTGAALSSISLSPNPAYRDVSVRFTLSQNADVALEIYNVAGQSIRTLVDQPMSAGTHNLTWDRKDDIGREMSSGTYILTINMDNTMVSKTVVLVK